MSPLKWVIMMSSMNLAPCCGGCEPRKDKVCCLPRHQDGLKSAPDAKKAGKTNLRKKRPTKHS